MEIFNLLFLLLLLLTFRRKSNNKELSLQTCNVLKGIAILGVFVGHYSKEFHGLVLYKLFCSLGLFSVSLFFFISGYGLMQGVMHKADYQKSFLRKRVLPIILTYTIVVLFYWGISDFEGLDWKRVLLCCYTPFSWYIFSIISLYGMTYIALLYTQNARKIIIIVTLLLVVYIAVALYFEQFLPYPLLGGLQMITFIIGMMLATFKGLHKLLANNNWFALLSFLFFVFWGFNLTDKYVHWPKVIINVSDEIQSYIFPFVIFGFMRLVEVTRLESLWRVLQRYSLEIYLFHGCVLFGMLERYSFCSELYIFVMFSITLVLSVATKKVVCLISN